MTEETVPSARNRTRAERTEEFLHSVAERSELTPESVVGVYDGLVAELRERLIAGERISLHGLGEFYLQRHKGHRVQFGGEDAAIGDYTVLKFSAFRDVSQSFPLPERTS